MTAHGFVPDGGVNLYLLPANMRAIAVRSDFTEDDMDRVNAFVARAEGFLGGALASQSEARLALTFRGDTRASVLASATGCEILLDDLLRHLLWEDGRRPEDCVHIFYDRGQVTTTLKRALKYTQVFLKGDWNTAQQPDLNAWQHETARVRNTVVHAGYRPTLEQAYAALDAADGLQSYLGDLVLKLTYRFPRTALMLYGRDELVSRNQFTARVRAVLDDDQTSGWTTKFVRWRSCVERLIDDELFPGQIDSPSEDIGLAAVVDPPGQVTWVLHDMNRRRACRALVNEQLIPEPTRASLRTAADAIPADSCPLSIAVGDLYSAEPTEEWVSEHRRLPLHEVMVDGNDWY
ncbi:hypothetical protein ACQ7HM_11955 [Williamsia sp. MIQD14]|uniref:hypothetical protein n=1 Tax=Williamsia sp. MIQD14 TaxID=3425703 RepID=UPI003DA1C5FE